MVKHSDVSALSSTHLSSTQLSSTQLPSSLPIPRHTFSPQHRVSISFEGPGLTQQSFGPECDINVIMARYQVTGVLEHTKEVIPQFLDVSAMEFQDHMDQIALGKEVFASLPARVRDRFANDPVRLLEFVHDPANLEESVRLGFLDKGLLKPRTAAPAASAAPDGAAGAASAAAPPKPA